MKNSQRVESPEGVDLIPSRDSRIRTGDFLLPIQVQVEANPGKNTCNGSVAEHLTACTDELRGEHYGRIIASAKQLAALNHHHFGQDSTFTRRERTSWPTTTP